MSNQKYSSYDIIANSKKLEQTEQEWRRADPYESFDLNLKYPTIISDMFSELDEIPRLMCRNPIRALGELLCRPNVQENIVSAF